MNLRALLGSTIRQRSYYAISSGIALLPTGLRIDFKICYCPQVRPRIRIFVPLVWEEDHSPSRERSCGTQICRRKESFPKFKKLLKSDMFECL